MKTETQTHVPLREVKRAVANLVADAGGTKAAAEKIGVTHSMVSYVLGGKAAPGPKFLKHFGLKPMTVYVPVKGGA